MWWLLIAFLLLLLFFYITRNSKMWSPFPSNNARPLVRLTGLAMLVMFATIPAYFIKPIFGFIILTIYTLIRLIVYNQEKKLNQYVYLSIRGAIVYQGNRPLWHLILELFLVAILLAYFLKDYLLG